MSDTSTIRLMKYYQQQIGRPRFLSSLFRSPPENFHSTEEVEIDVRRQGRNVAIPVVDLRSGPRHMSRDKTVNKKFKPAVYKYESNVAAADLIKRAPGVDPYTDPDFAANATREAFGAIRELEDMFRDAIELMASQIMQTGTLAITDDAGSAVYSLDFQPKDATGTLGSGDLIVTTGTTWAADGSTGDPLGDLDTLANNMAACGYDATDLAFGATALHRFLKNATVLQRFNLINANFGQLNPQGAPPGGGASPVGRMVIGSRMFRLWAYDATYKHPQTGTITRFLHNEKVVMWADSAPRDLSWGAIPMFEAARDSRVASFLPSRMSFASAGIDLHIGGYFTQDAQNLVITVGCRPLTIPTAIDGHACLDITT